MTAGLSPTMRRLRELAPWLAAAGIAALSLWLRSGFPIYAVGANDNDDFLFLRLAESLRKWRWLGAYDNLTLVKGMFYPAFIAVTSALHIPLKLAEHLLYLGAIGALAFFVCRLSRSRVLGLVLFAFLAFNPVLWTYNLARVLRDCIYISLAPGVVTIIAVLCWQHLAGAYLKSRAMMTAFFAGLLCAAFWLTREEGVWIIPAVGVVCAFAAMSLYIDRSVAPEVKMRTAKAAGTALAMVAVIAVALVTAVAMRNSAAYGVFTDVEFKARGFQSAYGALARVKPDEWHRYVVVSHTAREKIYGVSPAAAELRPILDGPRGANWQRSGCEQQHIDPCPDILGGWFIWALRDAAAVAGHYRSGGQAEAYYRRMAREINRACADGRLDCLPPRVGLNPPFRMHYIGDAITAGAKTLTGFLALNEAWIVSLPSNGPPQRLATFNKLTGPLNFSGDNAAIARAAGWVAGEGGSPTINVIDGQGNMHGYVELSSDSRLDEALQARGLVGRRFTMNPECPEPDCAVVITMANGTVRQFPLTSLNDLHFKDPEDLFHVDSYDLVMRTASPERQHYLAWVRGIGRSIARAYIAMMPLLFASGCLGLLIAVWAFRRDPAALFLTGVCAAAATAVISRIALCAYLDVTSFPALHVLYLASATPFFITVTVLGNWLGVRALIHLGLGIVGKHTVASDLHVHSVLP